MHRIGRRVTTLVFTGMLVADIFLALHRLDPSDADAAVQGGAAATVYTVAQVRALIVQDPGRWVNHAVSVRGILEGPFVFCGETRPCPPATLGLIDTEDQTVAPDRYLPVAVDSVSFSTKFLRHIPVISSFVSLPQSLRFGRMAVYQLRVAADPTLCSRNPAVFCYEGLVVGGV